MVHPAPTWVVGASHAHPRTSLSNDDLEARVPGLTSGWTEKVLGIRSRRVLLPSEGLPALAEQALDRALAEAGWAPESVDALICGTSFVEDVLPATASLVSRDRCPDAVAFDVNAACASALYALTVARALMLSDDRLQRVAVCAAERPTAWADYDDRDSAVFWGDAAGCLLLDRAASPERFEVLATCTHNENLHAAKVRVRAQGSFHHDGRYSYGQVLKLSQRCAHDVLGQVGATVDDLAGFVGHQSNVHLLAELGEQLGIPWDRQWHNVEWAGNQGAAGVFTAFAEGLQRERAQLADGALVLLVAVGGGYSASAALLRWVR